LTIKHRLVDLNQTRASNGDFGDILSVGKRTRAVGESRNGKAVEQELAVWEVCVKGSDTIVDHRVSDLLDNGHALAVDVDQRETSWGRRLVHTDGERESLVLSGDWAGGDSQRQEDWQLDQVGVGA